MRDRKPTPAQHAGGLMAFAAMYANSSATHAHKAGKYGIATRAKKLGEALYALADEVVRK